MNKLLEVKTLLGHNNLSFSIECLQSFVQNASEKIQLTIFEDGTLTEDDRRLLLRSLPDSRVINKAECEKVVFNKLAAYPACLNYRKTVVYARKIFDLMLYDEQDCLYIDIDVYFLKKFSLPKFSDSPVFMLDSINAYSFKPAEFLRISFPIFPKVNSGFFFFPAAQFDLRYVETLLQNPTINKGYLRGISWLEQTIWSFLASRHSSLYYFDYNQVVMSVSKTPVNHNTICVHLVSTFRGQFESVKALGKNFRNNEGHMEPIKLIFAKQPLRAHHLYTERIIRKFRWYFKKE